MAEKQAMFTGQRSWVGVDGAVYLARERDGYPEHAVIRIGCVRDKPIELLTWVRHKQAAHIEPILPALEGV